MYRGEGHIGCIIGVRNAYKILVGKSEGTIPLWKIYEQDVSVLGRAGTFEDTGSGEGEC